MTVEMWRKTYMPHERQKSIDPSLGTCIYDGWSEQDKKIVSQQFCKNPKRVWSLLEMGERLYIVAGLALANRVGYFICKKPFDTEQNAPEIALGPAHGARARSLGIWF